MDRAEQLAVLSGAAADQWGLVTAAQAKLLGVNAVQLRRLTETGLLENVSRGVYLLAAGGLPRHLEIKAAWLRLQPGAFAWERPAGHPDSGVVSHASACRLHELGDIPAPSVEITTPRRRTTTEPFVRLRSAPLRAGEATVVDGLPVTTPDRTIVDLLQAKADGGHIGGVIVDAERRGLVSLDDLAERVRPYARKYGLKATASGHDLIDHLVAQAGESLRRHEVERAGQEGFDAAVRLLAEHPGLAASLAQHRQYAQSTETTQRAMQDLARPSPAMTEALRSLTALRDTAQSDPAITEVLRSLSQFPALADALRSLTALRSAARTDSALAAALRQGAGLPPTAGESLGGEANPYAAPKRSASPPSGRNRKGGDNVDDRPEQAEGNAGTA